MVKNLPIVQETQVQSLRGEDPHGEVNGNPLHYFCLKSYMDRRGWWAIVHGVAKSGHDWATNTFTLIFKNFNPQLKC